MVYVFPAGILASDKLAMKSAIAVAAMVAKRVTIADISK